MKISLQHKVQAGFIISLVFLLLTGAAAFWSERRNNDTLRSVERTQETIGRLNDTLVEMLNIETGGRGFALTGNESFLEPHEAGKVNVWKAFEALKHLAQDNPGRIEHLAALEPLIQKRIQYSVDAIELRRAGKIVVTGDGVSPGGGKQSMDAIRRIIAEATNDEAQLFRQRSAEAGRANRITTAIVIFGGVLAIGLIGVSGLMVRRQVEERQRASEDLDSFFGLSVDLFGLAHTDGYFKRVNPAFASTLGWSADEITSRPFLDLVHADDRSSTIAEVEKLARGETTAHFINRYMCRDGSYKTIAWRAVPQPDGMIYCTGRDMTEILQAEEARRRSEENLSVTLHSIGDAVLATDTGGRVTLLNPVAERLTGWSQAEAAGRPVAEVFNIINENSRQPAVIPVDDVLATGLIQGLANHTILISRTGVETPISDSAAPIRHFDGRILGVVLVFRDVSEERKAAAAVREAESRYTQLFDSIDEGFCVIQMIFDENEKPVDYRFIEVNPSFERQTGMHNALGKTMREIAPDHEEHWFEVYGRIAITGAPERFQNHAERLNRHFDVYALRFGEPSNRQVAIVFNDITHRKLAEDALRQSEESLSVTLHSIGDAVMATDTKGLVTRLNPIAESLTGWTEKEAHGRPVAEVFNIINEETRQPALIPVDDVLATGEVHGLANHTILIARDGTECPIADSASPIRDKNGEVLGVVLVFRDVTEEKEAERVIRYNERQLRILNDELERRVEERTSEMRQALTTLDASDDGALIFDPETLVHTYVNEGMARQLGYEREELLGKTPLYFKPEYDEDSYREILGPIVRGELRSHRFTTVHRHRDGYDFPVEVNLQYVAPEGEKPRFIAIVRDITERQQLEEQLRQSQKMEAIGVLAGGIAHDFNNLLTAINGYSEIVLKKMPVSDPLHHNVEEIRAAGDRAAALTTQLLAFSRKQVMKPVVHNLNDVITNIEKMLRRIIRENIDLKTVLDPDLGNINADPGQIEQVIMNLVVNARDAMPDGGRLTVETQNIYLDEDYASEHIEVTPGPFARMTVTDTGAGMDERTQSQIFEPFFTTKGVGQGTGLGLSTVFGIIKQSGGDIRVYSEIGHGTIFKIYLPCVDKAVEKLRWAETGDDLTGTETVLLVEDEEVVRNLVREILATNGYTVLEAANGPEALSRCESYNGPIHLLLTDMIMPGMSGPELRDEVATLRPGIRVLFMSGYTDDSIMRNGTLDLDMSFIEKPFTPDSLSGKIREVLEAK